MSSPTFQKRQKEIARQARQRDKEAERRRRKEEKSQKPAGTPGVDPDIAHIVPGPQPPQEEG